MKIWQVAAPLLLTVVAGCSCSNSSIKFDESIHSPNRNSRIKYIVLHYTATNFKNTVDIFTNNSTLPREVSAHYVIPENLDSSYHYKKLKVFRLVKNAERAWHAGVSSWKCVAGLNDQSIGIELVNRASCRSIAEKEYCYFSDFDPQQIKLLLETLNYLMIQYPHIQATNIIAHSDIAPNRKLDPGPRFPWELLYRHGHGAWFDYQTMIKYAEKFTLSMPSLLTIQQALRKYGYNLEISGEFDKQTSQVVSAFQRHFVQDNVTGVINIKTAAVLFALMEKYYPDCSFEEFAQVR
jgi:N-acetylmuramoyl-L-alanine amidase